MISLESLLSINQEKEVELCQIKQELHRESVVLLSDMNEVRRDVQQRVSAAICKTWLSWFGAAFPPVMLWILSKLMEL